ncbi:conserved protein of unknown function [Bacillus velezensis]|nr:protein of unknown function [Bacillus velezensis UCMB5033]CUX94272.1 conserved protein of unknown function [Bacillus velezensis]
MRQFPSFPVYKPKHLQKTHIQFKINSTYMGEKNEDCPVFSFLIFSFMLSYIITRYC